MKKSKLILEGSSMVNAIFICLMISIFCGCLVLLSSYQDLLNNKLSLQEKLIHRNISAFNSFLAGIEDLSLDVETEIDLFGDGIYSKAVRKKWVFHEVLVVKTFFKGDTITKAALVGAQSKKNKIALYLTDYDKLLKVSGDTKIIGETSIPSGRVEQAYINAKSGNTVKLNGKKYKSKDRLPKIYGDPDVNINYKTNSLHAIGSKEVLINDFFGDTKIIRFEELNQNNLALKGNYIVISDIPIEITPNLIFHDVVIKAPKVTFKSGFRGNVHVIANKEVVVEDSVSLQYPSSIYVKNDRDSCKVTIGRESSILGSIIITGDTYQGSLKRSLKIAKGAILVGHFYSYGKTELLGEIRGSLYTDKFYLKTESSEYENTILNGIIDLAGLPEGFIGLPLLSNTPQQLNYDVIKEL